MLSITWYLRNRAFLFRRNVFVDSRLKLVFLNAVKRSGVKDVPDSGFFVIWKQEHRLVFLRNRIAKQVGFKGCFAQQCQAMQRVLHWLLASGWGFILIAKSGDIYFFSRIHIVYVAIVFGKVPF